MYRVYRLFGGHRYYWCKAHFWTEWSWAAKPLPLAQAQQVAQAEYAEMERFSGKRGL